MEHSIEPARSYYHWTGKLPLLHSETVWEDAIADHVLPERDYLNERWRFMLIGAQAQSPDYETQIFFQFFYDLSKLSEIPYAQSS